MEFFDQRNTREKQEKSNNNTTGKTQTWIRFSGAFCVCVFTERPDFSSRHKPSQWICSEDLLTSTRHTTSGKNRSAGSRSDGLLTFASQFHRHIQLLSRSQPGDQEESHKSGLSVTERRSSPTPALSLPDCQAETRERKIR